jgi:curved DNA-binding protein
MKYKDYYATLGVTRTASDDEIKKAYRRLARKYHPDVSKEANAKEQFQEVSEAYEALKDKEKRAAYDGLGTLKAGEEMRPPPDWQQRYNADGATGADDLGGLDLADLFAALNRGHGRGPQAAQGPMPGEDYEAAVPIGLEDAMHGTEVALQLAVRELGADGRIARSTKHIKARIPAGATDGQRLRLRGQGAAGHNGGPAGDLYLHVALHPHPLFRTSKHDLYLDVPVTPWEAALGAQVEIPTPSGRVSVKIAPGSKAGQQLRLAGKGIPKPQGGAGDLYAVISIAVPATLTDSERKLFEELRVTSSFNPRAHLQQ